jgi:galactose-1-phosphate uridylyltransferase
MSELRQDPTTGRLVIVAPHRQLRPGAQPLARQTETVARPAFDPHCPFCDGGPV